MGSDVTSSSDSNSSGNTTSLTGYMAQFTNGVMFIAWTTSDNQLTGSLQETYQDNTLQLHSFNEAITGTISASSISISASLWGITQTFVGTLDTNGLTLSLPQQNGSLQVTTFNSATVNNYNAAVSSFTASLQNQQATVTEQQNEQQNVQAIASEQSQLSSAENALQSDSDFSTILTAYNDHINDAKNDLQQEQNETDCGLKQGDAGLVQGDNELIQSDDSRMQSQTSSLNSDMQTIQSLSQMLGQSVPDMSNATNAMNDAKSKASQFDATMAQILQQASNLAKC